ncbi:MAG TPA: trehalose-phosphatase, partial [Solirubrobacterales bacterium]|nr:trehalose-phosphatase [Solirubrobacterales bacterium]
RDTKAVPPADETGEGGAGHSPLAPLRAEKARTAILTDVDGTLAPIVERPELAAVPPRASELLRELNRRFGLVGCISGRQALEARRLVGVEEISYAGNHGLELLLPGEAEPQLDPALAGAERVAADFIAGLDAGKLAATGFRLEDKGPIQSLHWRGAADERAAEACAHEIAAEAGRAELNRAGAARCSSCARWGAAARTRPLPRSWPARTSSPPSLPVMTAPTLMPSAAYASSSRKASCARCSASG